MDTQQPAAPVDPAKKNETIKDVCTIGGIVLDVLNIWFPFMHSGVGVEIGLGLRALLNLFGGKTGQVLQSLAWFLLAGLLFFGATSCAMLEKPVPSSCQQCVEDYLASWGVVPMSKVEKMKATPTPAPTLPPETE